MSGRWCAPTSPKSYRGQGLQRRLLEAGIAHATAQGVPVLEAYPVDKPERSHDDFMFFGSRSLYEAAGFTEVVRRSPTRVVMRKELGLPTPILVSGRGRRSRRPPWRPRR